MASQQDNHEPVPRRELLAKEFLAVLILTIILIGLSLSYPAGYTTAAPDSSAFYRIRAPWLIIWLQVLLRSFSPLIAGFIVPTAVLIIFACLPWIPLPGTRSRSIQYWFGFHRIIVTAIISALAWLTYLGL